MCIPVVISWNISKFYYFRKTMLISPMHLIKFVTYHGSSAKPSDVRLELDASLLCVFETVVRFCNIAQGFVTGLFVIRICIGLT